MTEYRYSELMRMTMEEVEAIFNADPDCDVIDDREAALSPEERRMVRKLLVGDPLTEAEQEQLGRYQAN